MSTAAKKLSAKESALRGPKKSRTPELLIFAALALITFILFAPVRHHEFINYDDPVTEETRWPEILETSLTEKGALACITQVT